MKLKIALAFCLLVVGCSYDKSVKQDESTNYIGVEFSSLVLEFQQDFENAAKKWNQKRVMITGYMHPTTNSTPHSTFSFVPFLSMKFGGYDEFEVVRVSLRENITIPYVKNKLKVCGVVDVGQSANTKGLSLNKAYIDGLRPAKPDHPTKRPGQQD